MKIKIADTFFKSLETLANHEKWYFKLYFLFRYDIPRFIKNIIRFKKQLWEFYPWDDSYTMKMFKRSLELTADHIENHGNEIDETRLKKVKMMRRAISLLHNHIEENFIEQAELELGLEVKSNFEFEECERTSDNEEKIYRLVDKTSENEQHDKKLVYEKADVLEKEQWNELWNIIKGQDPCPSDMKWEEYFDGSGLRSWWD